MSVAYEVLERLSQTSDSQFLKARLSYAEANTLLTNHIRPMSGVERIYPTMVIPQASGRVGISDPPIGNFTADKSYGPKGLRDVVRPDVGTKWICPDYNAVEAGIVSHRCQDPIDEEARRRGLDLHAVTAISILGYPDPPCEPTKENLSSGVGLEWAQRVGFDKDTRDGIKNSRYAMQYAYGDKYRRFPEKIMATYAQRLGQDPKTYIEYGRLYLARKPWLVSFKAKRWDEIWRLKEARTSFGRRRRFPGASEKQRMHVEKEGFNHEIQGTVADICKMTQVALAEGIPGCRMVLQRHDGWYSEVPMDWDDWDTYKKIMEREFIIDGRPISFPAEYEVWI